MTPKELMISRYEAFEKEDWQYLEDTSTSQKKEELEMMPKLQWLKLDVLSDDDKTVEFKAYYKENNKIFVLHEKSNFIYVDGVLKYENGKLFNSKVERNEPCPCGSNKKFKKCCG